MKIKLTKTGLVDLADVSLTNRNIELDDSALLVSHFAMGGLFFEKKDMHHFKEIFQKENNFDKEMHMSITNTVYDNRKAILKNIEQYGFEEKDWDHKRNQNLLRKALESYLVERLYTDYIYKKKEDYDFLRISLINFLYYQKKTRLIKEYSFRRNVFPGDIYSKSVPGLLNISIIHYLDFKELLHNTNEIIDEFIFDLETFNQNSIVPFLEMDAVGEILREEFI